MLLLRHDTALGQEMRGFVLNRHWENLGLVDFLGVELAGLQVTWDDYGSRVPAVQGGGPRGSKLSFSTGVITFIKAFVGIGCLALPYSMKLGGYVAGPIIFLLCGLLAYH